MALVVWDCIITKVQRSNRSFWPIPIHSQFGLCALATLLFFLIFGKSWLISFNLADNCRFTVDRFIYTIPNLADHKRKTGVYFVICSRFLADKIIAHDSHDILFELIKLLAEIFDRWCLRREKFLYEIESPHFYRLNSWNEIGNWTFRIWNFRNFIFSIP